MKEQLELLPGYLASHIRLVVVALAVCTAASVPLGVAATRSPRLERVVVGLASVVQTVPALALLAIMVPVLGAAGLPAIGVLPALIGLTLYCSLPILLSTVTGIREVAPPIVEAARGVGMTDRQVLRLVELPLAAPYIIAGLRTAAVWCVGMATLSTPIGAPSLGNFIFGGLQTRNHAATLTGCVAAAVLALVLDGLVRSLEVGLRKRKKPAIVAGVVGLSAFAAFTVVSFAQNAFDRGADARIHIGAKSFTEQYVLGQVLSQTIHEETGKESEVVESLGSSVVFDALATGRLDLYVDYTGTVWTTVLTRQEIVTDREKLLADVERELRDQHGVETLAALGFENTYCLAVREEDAERLGLHKLSDLASHARTLVIGADYEFFSRREWVDLQRVYGYTFAEKRSMDPALMYQAAREKQVDVVSAFSTDGRIAAYGLRVLEDDRHVIPPYDAIILARKGFSAEHPDIAEALKALAGTIDAATMREMNRAVDEQGRTPAEVARSFVQQHSRKK
ncbi:MAG: ABC transporter permease subunit [Polyangiaceae bacterium]|nr:ABC transporter permease subunit [Polyangiaceae bacterium]